MVALLQAGLVQHLESSVNAKNFSIILKRGGDFRLTSLYDVLSAWPIIGNGPNMVSPRRVKLAMAMAMAISLLPLDFPRAVFKAIRRGMLAQTKNFAAEMP